ncbi:hypothetical protein FHU38_000553 [Saccharomonospora amisosensis]|uniref:Uncharacterized protein n=1 Tax=Saccharomonospora amisosensis TaxID=1128677 RepID=A0A7X5ZP06_9PSEU|nr:hypothetical protein [Saccharomonospora amisosensis]NIJ10209.1 hypothetical protein [Saccharomonospora amisosensis]
MRTVRRGMVAVALALPLSFGATGIASATDDGGASWGAEYGSEFAVAGPEGAVVGGIHSEADGFMNEGRWNNGSGGSADYTTFGAFAGPQGAATFGIHSESWWHRW